MGAQAQQSPAGKAFKDLYVGTKATGSIVCPARSALSNGQYLTLSDGVNTPVKFEPRAKAQSTITLISLAEMTDNATLIVNDGIHTATTFEAQISSEFVPTGEGVIAVDLHEIDTDEAAAQAFANAINAVTTNLVLTAGDATGLAFVVTEDSTGAATITVTGTLLDSIAVIHAGLGGEAVAGAVAVDLTGLPTAAEGATALAAAINGVGSTLIITAAVGTDTVSLVRDSSGIIGNVIITQTGGTSYTVTGMSGGLDAMQPHAASLAALAARANDILALLD